MAANINCDNHSDLAAFFMITMIPEAETVSLCLDCGCDWAQGLMQAMRPEQLTKPKPATPRKRSSKAAAAAAANGAGEQVNDDAAAAAAEAGTPAT